jgi:hypothetical protein
MATAPKVTEHELFPAEGDEDPKPVNQIHVTRFEGGGGQAAYCRHLFEADELPNLDALFELFGGGNYELIGRCKGATSNPITARRRLRLDGASRPLNPSPDAPAVAAAPPVVHAPGGMPGDAAGLFGFLASMMNAQAQSTAAMMAAMMQSNAQIIGAIAGGRGGGQADAALAQAVSALAAAASANRGAGSEESFVKGAEMAAELARAAKPEPGGSDGDDLASVASSIATIAGAVNGGREAGATGRAGGAGAPPGMQGGDDAAA